MRQADVGFGKAQLDGRLPDREPGSPWLRRDFFRLAPERYWRLETD